MHGLIFLNQDIVIAAKRFNLVDRLCRDFGNKTFDQGVFVFNYATLASLVDVRLGPFAGTNLPPSKSRLWLLQGQTWECPWGRTR